MIFGDAVEEADLQARLGLAGRHMRIERFGFRARDIPQVLSFRRDDLAEIFRRLSPRRTAGGGSETARDRDELQRPHIRKDSVLGYDPSIS